LLTASITSCFSPATELFRSLVESVQRRGVHVTVVSTISSQPPMLADELRRQADVFADNLTGSVAPSAASPKESV
jgi:hypothetical protein